MLSIREYQNHVHFVNTRIFSTVTAISKRIISSKTQVLCYFFRRVRKSAKSDCQVPHACLSVHRKH